MNAQDTNNRAQLPLIFSSADYVSVSWAAKALDVGRVTILRFIQEGKLVAHQKRGPGGWWSIKKESVIALQQSFLEQERDGEISQDSARSRDDF
jgi:hypothetical protein